ncbi:MAG: DNA repair protein RecO [Shewanella sp.]|nr:DNA repair protein RecO [Shewanella sp.]MCF1431031.1 DNA repair protein RecO [Shewanella sp.]MCF1439159.1 DNA repair protein RecO [Shewanella sp.]MCF1456475.1 DNA repair protein RecO [Shewanella sp.]
MKRGYVLHSRPYRESSMIVNLLVDGEGRVDAVVRLGSGKRSLKSIIQPFHPLLFSLSGCSDLKTLSRVEPMSPAIPLHGDSLYAGMYLNELLMRLVHHGGESLFLVYHRAIMTLAREFGETQLRLVELALLKELGCMPCLTLDGLGQEILPEQRYQFLAEQGFWPLIEGVSDVRGWYGSALLGLDKAQITAEDLPALKMLMRLLLHPLLGDKPLRSRALFAGRRSPSTGR